MKGDIAIMVTHTNYTISELASQLKVTRQAIDKHIDKNKMTFRKVYQVEQQYRNNRDVLTVKLTDEDLETLKLAAGKNGTPRESTEVSTTIIKNQLENIVDGLTSIEHNQSTINQQLINRLETLEQQNKELIEQLNKPLVKRLKLW